MSVQCEEELLRAWIQMTMCIRGNRILTDMSTNEMIIYGMLFSRRQEGKECMTATEIGEQTRLLKSQVNKILSDMEKDELIERVRSDEDRRKVYISLREEKIPLYLKEHRKVMELMRAVDQELGEEKMRTLTKLVDEAIGVADRFQRERGLPQA